MALKKGSRPIEQINFANLFNSFFAIINILEAKYIVFTEYNHGWHRLGFAEKPAPFRLTES